MSRRRRNDRQASYEKGNVRGGRTRNAYVYGNVAYDLDIQRQLEEEPRPRLAPAIVRNRAKVHCMSTGYVLFLAMAMCVCALILVTYVQRQAELTTITRSVAMQQSKLNTLKTANDEEYSRITNSVDLEEIKRVAIGELGMVYAGQGQIVFYTNEGNDYMRQVD